jgi:hypothetical protein
VSTPNAALLGPILGLGSDDGSPLMDLEFLMRSANRASLIQAALARNRTHLAERLRDRQQQARRQEDALYSRRNRVSTPSSPASAPPLLPADAR